MDRRFLTVVMLSLLFALVVSAIFYQFSSKPGSARTPAEPVQMKELVVATRPLTVGVSLTPDDVKLRKVPAAQFPAGAFSKVEDVLDRAVISGILIDEAIHEGRLADRGSGVGLAPVIPVGMRAVTVRVNEVVGVAGFALPGMRVDVLVTGQPPESKTAMTSTALQNILVLSAGQTTEPDAAGNAINAPTVTLLVTPAQAEVLTLAGTEGRIQLVLRNSSDREIGKTPGHNLAQLYGVVAPPPAPPVRPRPVKPASEEQPPAAAPVKPEPRQEEVVVFRGTQKTVEVVNAAKSEEVVRQ